MHLYILFNWCIQKKTYICKKSLAGNVKLLKTIREFLTNYYIMKYKSCSKVRIPRD